MKRYSLVIVMLLAFLAVSMGSTVLAADNCCTQNGKAVKASCADKDCPKVCKDKGQCSPTCSPADCMSKGKCTDATKSACTAKAACEKKQCGPAKTGACAQKACKGTPGK